MRNTLPNGRSKERYVRLPYGILNHYAWCSLTSHAKVLYIELCRRYNGGNNGEISCSRREAGEVLHISKSNAERYFTELVTQGFIKPVLKGKFRNRFASTWTLTSFPIGKNMPTFDWQKFRPFYQQN